MGRMGVNGWYYSSIANYYGNNHALPICGSCSWLKKEKGEEGGFKYSLVCKAGTDCAAAEMGNGRMVNDCPCYDKVESKSKGGGGKKRPIWLRIVCCPCCCIWHTLGGWGKGIDPSRGCKKAFTW